MDKKVEGYYHLLVMGYDEAVKYLKIKYGSGLDDYYREKSYQRFLNGEIKHPGKGKYQRTKEGLYCHHIDEDCYINLSNEDYIRQHRYDFSLQKKERLIYCDIFEHLILHALIAIKTGGNYGAAGFETLRMIVVDNYINGINTFKSEWRVTAYKRAFVTVEEAKKLLEYIDNLLLKDAPRSVILRKKQEKEFEEQKKKYDELDRKRIVREREELEEKERQFEKKYPGAIRLGLTRQSSRKEVIKHLMKKEVPDGSVSFKVFSKRLIELDKEMLLARLDD